jgi:hypothetical protein
MCLKGFLDVNVCLKVFGAVLRRVIALEMSMLSRWVFLVVYSPDCGDFSFGNVDETTRRNIT